MVQRAMNENTSIRAIFDQESLNEEIESQLDFATIESKQQKAKRRSRLSVPQIIGDFNDTVHRSLEILITKRKLTKRQYIKGSRTRNYPTSLWGKGSNLGFVKKFK